MKKTAAIATFNPESPDTGHQAEFQNRIDALQPLLEQIRADLLFLQEGNSLQILQKLLDGALG